jgi:DNA-binding CsgD family transcriptional regulator/tetratricopeptide (TPR) repeat protein
VVQICRRLDGIPLAIELAAARLRVLSVEQIAARLDDVYRLLTRGSRTALPRQQTLRATMDWSYSLLSEQEQIVFRRLSVFAGGCTLEAVEMVCAGESIEEHEILDVLSLLVEKSLVLMEERDGEARYRLLETIRQYGQDRLSQMGELALARRRHRDWCIELAERAAQELLGIRQGVWLDRIETEHDNLRAALRWTLEQGEAETGARICLALWHFWLFRGYLSEGRSFHEEALATYGERTALRAKLLLSAGVLAFYQNDATRSTILMEEGLHLARANSDKEALAYALNTLGEQRRSRGDYEQAITFYEEGLPLLRELGDKRTSAMALSGWGQALLSLGEYERAGALCEESLALAREQGSPLSVASSLTALAMAVLEQSDYERARALCEESLAIRQRLGEKGGSAHTLAILGCIALEQGDDAQALIHYQASLALRQETGEQEGIATALEGLASVAVVQGQARSAAQLFGAADTLRTAINVPLLSNDRSRHERRIAAVRSKLNTAAFEEAWEQGRAMQMKEAIAVAEQLTLQEQARLSSSSAMQAAPLTVPQAFPLEKNAFGLTAREVQVLRLLTLGLTTLQIAERLIISPRTADAHLRSIYNKLGVTSRTAATRSAIEHKLV